MDVRTNGDVGPDSVHRRATRKVSLRLLPILLLVYFMAYIDRTSVALAKTALAADIGLSATAYGLGAGLLFITYALLEVPSNLVLYRIGARIWITRIAVTWGIITALQMLVWDEYSFYALRLLLGAAEAGLFPALMYTVSQWFAQADRPRIIGWVYFAPSLAMVLGGPLGGALMELDGFQGLHGWQIMFLVQGAFTVVVGIVLYTVLPNRPGQAKWLTPDEAKVLVDRAGGTDPEPPHSVWSNLSRLLLRPVLLSLSALYFLNQIATVGIIFYVPAIVEDLQVSGALLVGLVAGTAGIGAVLGVLLLPRLLGRMRNEAAALLVPIVGALVAAVAFLSVQQSTVRIVLIGVAMFFVMGMLPVLWASCMARMSGRAAAAGLAFLNTLGLIGAFVGPYVFGLVESATGDPSAGFAVIVATAVVSLAILPWVSATLRRDPKVVPDTAVEAAHP